MTKAAQLPTPKPARRQATESDRLEAAPGNYEEQYRNVMSLLRQAPALVAILRGKSGVIELLSDEFSRLWGDRDVIGKPVRSAWPELKKDGIFELIDDVFDNGVPIYKNEMRALVVRKIGQPKEVAFFSISIHPYKDENDKTDGVMIHGTEVTEQVHARRLAENSEERYHAFIRNSSEGIWRCELDEPIPITLPPDEQIEQIFKHAYMAEANDAMAGMYGLKSSKDLIGVRLKDLMVCEDQRNIEYLRAFIESGYNLTNVESHELDTDGNDKYFSNSLVGIIENGTVIRAWGSQLDMTEQHKAAQTLEASEERLQLALHASNMGMWEWNVLSGELTWSDQLKRLYGLKPSAEITFEKYLTLLHPDDRQKTQDIIQSSMKTGKEYKFEHRLIWPDGSEHWLLGQGKAYLEDGKAVRMIGTAIDIDELKEAQHRALESEERFRSMADKAPVFIWVTGIDNECTYLNDAWMEYTGWPKEEPLGRRWVSSIHPDDAPRIIDEFNRSVGNREPFNMEYRIRRHDGEYRHIIDNGIPRFSNEGVFLGYIGSCMDIEDLKHQKELELLNRKLRKQRTQLVALNHAKDEFIAIASHQLRTPATGVKQYVGMMLEGYAGDVTDVQRSMLQAAYDSNQRQIKIVDDLLRVARVDAGKVKLSRHPTDMATLLSDIIEEQSIKVKQRRQNITFKGAADVPLVDVDENLMRMVLENIIDNACKYSYEGKPVLIELKTTAKQLQLRIRDQGIGIDKRDQKRLFKKFSRVDNPLTLGVDGTGLGLYWAMKIIDLHGGTIHLQSEVNKGSTFTIRIPINKS